jgi:glycosyltransferase involved in cell wall biosynthesis
LSITTVQITQPKSFTTIKKSFLINLRYIFEAQQGLAFARRRAIQEAKGSIIGFLDDDNLPDDNWIAAAYEFF